jgi:hypothetical protein
MGQVVGAGDYSASGYIGAAIVGQQITLSFQNFSTSAEDAPLEAVLTRNGNLSKRPINLGPLPETSGAFDLAVPEGTDISLFNTVVMRLANTETIVGTASVP